MRRFYSDLLAAVVVPRVLWSRDRAGTPELHSRWAWDETGLVRDVRLSGGIEAGVRPFRCRLAWPGRQSHCADRGPRGQRDPSLLHRLLLGAAVRTRQTTSRRLRRVPRLPASRDQGTRIARQILETSPEAELDVRSAPTRSGVKRGVQKRPVGAGRSTVSPAATTDSRRATQSSPNGEMNAGDRGDSSARRASRRRAFRSAMSADSSITPISTPPR